MTTTMMMPRQLRLHWTRKGEDQATEFNRHVTRLFDYPTIRLHVLVEWLGCYLNIPLTVLPFSELWDHKDRLTVFWDPTHRITTRQKNAFAMMWGRHTGKPEDIDHITGPDQKSRWGLDLSRSHTAWSPRQTMMDPDPYEEQD